MNHEQVNDDQWDWVDAGDFDVPHPGSGPGLSSDPRIQAGLEHLQRAAREAIAASRALLDVAEELVEDPKAVGEVFQALSALGGLAVRGNRPGRASGGQPEGPPDGDDDSSVQRIPVS